jgi:hypothetical protein
MKRKSKQEMVLDIYDREAMGEVTAREIAVINQALVEEFGEGGAMTPAEIARILHDEDLPIQFNQVFRMMAPNEKYENLFDSLAFNTTLEQAEASIQRIDELYGKFQRTGDKTGVRFARQTARFAKRNAEEAARRHRAGLDRQEQTEIAQWFTVWLQTPDLFAQWLELRKATAEFKDLFEKLHGNRQDAPDKTGPK